MTDNQMRFNKALTDQMRLNRALATIRAQTRVLLAIFWLAMASAVLCSFLGLRGPL